MISRTRQKAILILLLVFLAGIGGGLVLEDAVDDGEWPSWLGGGRADSDRTTDPMDDDAEEEFLERLGLSRAQLEAVDSLLDEREDRLEAYWQANLPEIQTLIDSTRVSIRALLDPEQRRAYDQWIEQQRVRIPQT
jgi:hypothetical protein